MKNTLLAVLIIALCYDTTQAQRTPSHAPEFIKYQGTSPNQPVGKGHVTTNTLADGIITTDKLSNDIKASGNMADGAITSDKLADDINNSLKDLEDALGANKQAQEQEQIAVSLSLYKTSAINQQVYACYMQGLLPYGQQLQKPRPTYNRIGW